MINNRHQVHGKPFSKLMLVDYIWTAASQWVNLPLPNGNIANIANPGV